MRQIAVPVLFILMISLIPTFVFSNEIVQEITVYSGYLKPGETLKVDEYKIEVKIGVDGYPYLFVKGPEGGNFARADFGLKLVLGSVNVITGRYFDDKGLFLVVTYKVEGERYQAKSGVYFEGFSIFSVTNTSVELKYNGNVIKLPTNRSIRINGYLLKFDGDYIYVYRLPTVSLLRSEKSEGYIVVKFPYKEIFANPGSSVVLPLTIFNNGTNSTVITVSPLSIPEGWNATFTYNNVEVGSLEIEPKSYITLLLTVSIPQKAEGRHYVSFTINSEVVTLEIDVKHKPEKAEEFKIETPILSQEAEAGILLTFPMVVLPPRDVLVTISVKAPEGWRGYALYQGVRVSKIMLNKGQAGSLSIEVEVPRNAELGSHKVSVELKFYDTDGTLLKSITKEFWVNIYKTYKGEKATLKLIVVDESGMPVPRANVQINEETYGTDSNGMLEVKLDPGEYRIAVSKEGYEKKEEIVKLEDGEIKELKVMLIKEAYYFDVETESDVYSIVLGEVSVPLTVTIRNLGRNDDEYKLKVENLPEAWNAMFSQTPEGSIEITTIRVESGKAENVYLRIYPSLNSKPGIYNLTIVVQSSSGIIKRVPIKVKLIGSYRLGVNIPNYRMSITAGEEKSTTIALVNFGTAPITNIKITASGPQGWDIKVSEPSIPILDPKDSVRVMITIKVPEGTPAGDYRVRIQVKSDQQEWQDSIRVVVKQKSTSAYIGLLILVLAFGIVIYMMRRIGRR
ncbi:NEW3 domain-containing protein [Pyrococcus sp. ST04]|uniref:COG1470 family protein n=1 Tax=Pyrococcus sp. ST04 TaxID=1183377 RepID=UPI0002605AED|nr:NEW3 domain-containing protein [Pyrococcus sp. ST04]AFK22792.1 hypothetical protein Py04_1218 [Pyrococcus sp. ST04]